VALVPHRLAGLALVVGALLVPASAALAAPVTVNLRIEGPSTTLFEGPVTTDVRPFQFTTGTDTVAHQCDGTAANQGPSATPVPTRAAAVAAASSITPFSTSGTFSASLGSPSFDTIAGVSTAFDPATNSFLAEYKNGVFAAFGACGDPIADGDDVLFAYGTGNEQLLRLTGPATATAGTPVQVHVAVQPTGAAVAGAAVGGAITDAAGNATVTLTDGVQRLKATKAGTIRSNALVVGVGSAAAQGVAGVVTRAVDRTAPRARLLSPRSGHVYRYTRFSPRLFHIVVAESGSGLKTVKIRLTRRVGNRCFSYSGKRERFIGAKCGGGFFFAVGSKADFTYLLPKRLPRGHYVLDVSATDNAANRDSLGQRGRNRSVFDVR